jgi:dihydroflavonol-4-reductase
MVFVTGGTGALGTHILLELLSRGKRVRALKRPTSNLDQVKSVFDFYLNEKAESEFNKIEWVEGDVLDITSLEEGIQGCSEVYHCAAMVSFLRRDFSKMWQVNKVGTANVVNVCIDFGIETLCHISSTAAIGKPADVEEYNEDHKWVKSPSNSNYAVTKRSAEMEVFRGANEGLNVVILNPSVILGPGNWNESSLTIFKVVKKGLRFFTPGMNAFVDARDVANAATELVEQKVYNERFLVISENVYFKDLFNMIADSFNVKRPKTLVKPWMAGIAWRLQSLLRFLFGRKQNITKESARSAMSVTKYSNKKLKEKLNFQFIPIEESISNAVKYYDNIGLQ